MNIRVNGEEREVSLHLSLQALISHLNLAPERIAIELNQKVVRRADWPATLLEEDDRVEIVHFVGGGVTRTQETDGMKRAPGDSAAVQVSVFSALQCKVSKYFVVHLSPEVQSPTFRLPIRHKLLRKFFNNDNRSSCAYGSF